MITFLSLKSYAVFFFMDLLIGYLKAFQLEMGGGLDEKEYVRNGGVVARTN